MLAPAPPALRREAPARAAILPRGGAVVIALALAAMPIDALRGLGWVLRGKRVRGWNLLYLAASRHPDYYARWIAHGEPYAVAAYMAGRRASAAAPSVGCLILGRDADEAAARRTLDSVRAAFGAAAVWSDVAALAADDGPALDAVAGCDWLLPLRAGDVLSPALGAVLAHTALDPAATPVVFWDEDAVNGARRADPWIKPDWDPVLFLARDGVTGAALIARAAFEHADEALGGGAFSNEALGDAALDPPGVARRIAHMLAQDAGVLHIPLVLTHRAGGAPFVPAPEHRAIAAIRPSAYAPATPATWPSVSIVVPTRDRADLLETCLAGLDRLDYPGPVELLVIDNDSVEPRTHALFARLRADGATILPHPGAFNYAALVNHAAGVATGEMLCLLNNDIELPDGAWLTQMVRYAVRDRVGAVGARLAYPDGRIQHAGVAIGIGDAAGHVQKGVAADDPHFAEWHAHSRIVSAVTGACLVVAAAKFAAAGGMDAETFAVDFNDVDFCLRLQAMGLANVLAVEASMIHHESVSRAAARQPGDAIRFARELAALRARWHTVDAIDPHYSPRFRRACEPCILAF